MVEDCLTLAFAVISSSSLRAASIALILASLSVNKAGSCGMRGITPNSNKDGTSPFGPAVSLRAFIVIARASSFGNSG